MLLTLNIVECSKCKTRSQAETENEVDYENSGE